VLEDTRARPQPVPNLREEEKRRFLVQLDSRRRLVQCQLEIEAWLADWQRAAEAQA